MPDKIDTIDVRPDERFDEARLADYLRGRLPGSDRPLAVRQFGGGAANLTYLLDYGASTGSAPVLFAGAEPVEAP